MSTLDFQIKGYEDDPDILAKAEFVVDDQKYEVLVVTSPAPAMSSKYLPEVIDLEQEGDIKRMLVTFDHDHLSKQLDDAVRRAQAELIEIDDETNYAMHVGTAGASVISLWINRSMEAAKAHIKENG